MCNALSLVQIDVQQHAQCQTVELHANIPFIHRVARKSAHVGWHKNEI